MEQDCKFGCECDVTDTTGSAKREFKFELTTDEFHDLVQQKIARAQYYLQIRDQVE